MLERAGEVGQALAIYRQLVEDDPAVSRYSQRVGDLSVRLNKIPEAIEAYAKAADVYARENPKAAIALWKKIDQLDPSSVVAQGALGELYAKQGRLMEAKGSYAIVVDRCLLQKKSWDAREAMRRMVEIDPSDLKVRSKLADLYLREGSPSHAADEHVAIANLLSKRGYVAEALQVLEHGARFAPTYPGLLQAMQALRASESSAQQEVDILFENWPTSAAAADEQALVPKVEDRKAVEAVEYPPGVMGMGEPEQNSWPDLFPTAAAFLSYVRADDAHDDGRISELRDMLSGEVAMRTGQAFPIFQDRDGIEWGEAWEQRLDRALDDATFLIAIITPRFFRSSACRKELMRFRDLETMRSRSDLILPLYYVDCPQLDDETIRMRDPLACVIASRQRQDWRLLRLASRDERKKHVVRLAEGIVAALRRQSPPRA